MDCRARPCNEPLTLGVLESFYVGGTTRVVESSVFGVDTQVVGAMYVQRTAPRECTFAHPVIFIHGGMHSGMTWETTPDGREGWQTLFVRGGFDTLVIDQAWRGRSAPDLTALNSSVSVREEVPAAFTCGMNIAAQFARGGTRFPMDALRHYAAQLWPDFGVPAAFARGMPGFSDPRSLPPLLDLIDQLECVVLVTHSQGGHLGWQAALARPNKVAAILAIEPALTSPGLDDARFPSIPVCVMWGDNLPSTARTLSLEDVAQARAIASARPMVTLDLLPEHGIFGNGHMLMMEDNSAELAARAMQWFRSLGVS
jgi:pimeloyl-ACP methyl ester carboxylesterase